MNFGWNNILKYLGFGGDVRKGNHFFSFGGETFYFDLDCEEDYLRAYNYCPPLKSIIGKRAKAFNNGNIELINKNTGNYATGSANFFLSKLEQPNILQSKKQFFSQQNHYIDIFGYCPYIVLRPSGMTDEISSIWNIPPWLFDIEYSGKWLKQTKLKEVYKEFSIYWNGQKDVLDYDSVKFIFDDGIGTEIDTNLTIPDSRLKGLDYPVSNIVAAYKSRNTLITKRGAIGILSNDSKDQAGVVPLLDGQKEALQADMQRYGLTGQQFQMIVTDAALKWQQMGFSTKDLMLFEEIQDDIYRLCDAYGWPAELVAQKDGVTFDNKKEATKAVYRDTIIPEGQSRISQFGKGILPDNLELRLDFSDVEVLQEDAKNKAEARKALNEALQLEYNAGLITKNMWLKELGRDEIKNDPAFDEYKNINDEAITPEDKGIEA